MFQIAGPRYETISLSCFRFQFLVLDWKIPCYRGIGYVLIVYSCIFNLAWALWNENRSIQTTTNGFNLFFSAKKAYKEGLQMNCFCDMADQQKGFTLISTSRIWACAEPQLRLNRMKLCSGNNHYTTAQLFTLFCPKSN